MNLRRGWLVCLLLCLGCKVVIPGDLTDRDTFEQPNAVSDQRPLGFFESSLASQPEASRSHLSRAAEHLSQGDEAAACLELASYLAERPDHFEVRIHLAELSLKSGKTEVAQVHFTHAIAQAQEVGDESLPQRVRCHRLLMELAESQDDDYGLHFHRGVALYLLAVQRAKLTDPNGNLPVEGLLCKAASELLMAHMQQPTEARPCLYLHHVRGALGQQTSATRWLNRAGASAPYSMLTAAEQRSLGLNASPVGTVRR